MTCTPAQQTLDTLKQQIKESSTWIFNAKAVNPAPHPLYTFLQNENRQREKGWIRGIIRGGDDVDPKTHLSSKDNQMMLLITMK